MTCSKHALSVMLYYSKKFMPVMNIGIDKFLNTGGTGKWDRCSTWGWGGWWEVWGKQSEAL